VVATLSAAFMIVLSSAEVQGARTSVREEIEAQTAWPRSSWGAWRGLFPVGGPDLGVHSCSSSPGTWQMRFACRRPRGGPVPVAAGDYKAGREARWWFAAYFWRATGKPIGFRCPRRAMEVQAQKPARAVLECVDDVPGLPRSQRPCFVS